MLELYRLAAPLPTILPSYNQIGFDSLHYVVGIAEGSGDHYIAWVVGGTLDAHDQTVIDPTTRAVFALDVDASNGLVTMGSDAGFSLEVMGATIAFHHFAVSAHLDANGDAGDSPSLVVSSVCADIQLYGPFSEISASATPTPARCSSRAASRSARSAMASRTRPRAASAAWRSRPRRWTSRRR